MLKKIKMLKNLPVKLMSLAPVLALAIAISSASATCYFFYHQPDLPDVLAKYDR
jgi:cyclic lactone autoinducer peptide